MNARKTTPPVDSETKMRSSIFKYIKHIGLTWIKLHEILAKHPKAVLFSFTVVALCSLIHAIFFLTYEAEQEKMISEYRMEHAKYYHFLRNYPGINGIFAIMQWKTDKPPTFLPEKAQNFARKIESIEEVKHVFHSLSTKSFIQNMLFSMASEKWNIATLFAVSEIQKIKKHLQELQPSKRTFNETVQFLTQTGNSGHHVILLRGIHVFLKKLLGFMENKTHVSYQQLINVALNQDINLLIPNEQKFLLFSIVPHDIGKANVFFERQRKKLNSIIFNFQQEFPEFQIGFTGKPVMNIDMKESSTKDINIATLISIIGIGFVFFRWAKIGTTNLLALLLCLIGAICCSFGISSIAIGHLNQLSSAFTVILICLGVDFGIHFIRRTEQELGSSKNMQEALKLASTTTGKSNFFAAMTSALAFLSGCFIPFKAIQELGFIAFCGIILVGLWMHFALPAILLIFNRKNMQNIPFCTLFQHKHNQTKSFRPLAIAGIVIPTFFAIFTMFGSFHFNRNILNLYPHNIESVNLERKLNQNNHSGWPSVVVMKKNNAEMLRKLQNLSVVKTIESPFDFISEKKQQNLKKLQFELESWKGIVGKWTPLSLNQFLHNIEALMDMIGKNSTSLDIFPSNMQENTKNIIHDIRTHIMLLHKITHILSSRELTKRLLEWENILQQDVKTLMAKIQNFSFSMDNLPMALQLKFFPIFPYAQIESSEFRWIAQLVKESDRIQLRKCYRFDSSSSAISSFFLKKHISKELFQTCANILKKTPLSDEFLTYVYPKNNLWENKNLDAFVHDIKQVANITGPIVSFLNNTQRLQDSLVPTCAGLLLALTLLLFFRKRNIIVVTLIMFPVFSGIAMVLGFLSLSQWFAPYLGTNILQFHFANFLGLPIIIGAGLDHGIHIIDGMTETNGNKYFYGLCSSITFSAITTIIGFGSLIVTSNPGLRDLGLLVCIGLTTTWVCSIWSLPMLFKLFMCKTHVQN